MRLNPHLHLIALDGTWREKDGELAWEGLGHLRTCEVGEVLERLVRRMERHLRRSGQFGTFEDEGEADGEGDPEGKLAASAVCGQAPPAGPQWVSRLAPLEPQALAYDKPLCVSLDGFTLHAATRAGALDSAGREALLRYVLRPPVAQERVEQRADGRVRITLKKAYTDGTIAVDMDPLSLRCRLCHPCAPTAVSHREVRGCAGPGQRVEVASRAPIARSRRPGRQAGQAGSRRGLPPVGGAFGAYLRGRCPRLPQVPGADEAARAGQESGTHRSVPRYGGGGDRGTSAVARSRAALLEEPRAAPQGSGRRGRGRRAWPQGRRGGRVAAGRQRGWTRCGGVCAMYGVGAMEHFRACGRADVPCGRADVPGVIGGPEGWVDRPRRCGNGRAPRSRCAEDKRSELVDGEG